MSNLDSYGCSRKARTAGDYSESRLALPHSLRQGLGKSWNPGDTGISKAPRLLMDEAIAIVVVLGVVFANLIVDLLYAAVNPRFRCRWQDKPPVGGSSFLVFRAVLITLAGLVPLFRTQRFRERMGHVTLNYSIH